MKDRVKLPLSAFVPDTKDLIKQYKWLVENHVNNGNPIDEAEGIERLLRILLDELDVPPFKYNYSDWSLTDE
tara:strand:- start:474 stop:689 length:216 start_codon:yes stop_codon:yes gene_type:complete